MGRDVDGIEIDVQLTRDHELVLYHDDGIWIKDQYYRIRDLTLSELNAFKTQESGRSVARLQDVLLVVCTRNILIILDLKTINLVGDVIRVIKESNVSDKVLIATFDYAEFIQGKQKLPECKFAITVGFSRAMKRLVGFICAVLGLLLPVTTARVVGASAILCPTYRLSRYLVKRSHKAGIAVLVWGIADQASERKVVSCGIDGFLLAWSD
jgi:glycerophosphoryl diester phosphodiesterase